jgi:hypothetical protein
VLVARPERPTWPSAVAVAAFYALFAAAALLLHGGDPMWFVWAGERFTQLDPAGRLGYDGQFVYYLAVDGWAAVPRLDAPAYRLQRILLPLIVRLLAVGSAAAVPWVIVAVNLAALVAATAVLGRWLRDRGLSVWWALAFSLFVGQVMAFSRDLTEPLAYALTAAGACAWLDGRRGRTVLFFALAGLTKETTLFFPAALLAAQALRLDRRAWPLLLSFLPLALWELVLYGWFGQVAFTLAPKPVVVPLAGIVSHLNPEPGRLSALFFVALPALGLLVWAGWRLRRTPRCAAWWMVAFNAAPALFYGLAVYDHLMHAGRNISGLVLASLFTFPQLETRARVGLLALWVTPTVIWVIPMLRWAPWLATR